MRTFLNLLVAAAGLLAATSVRASPTPIDGPHTLDVFVPTIITPDAETVWEVGHAYDVTWCAFYSLLSYTHAHFGG